MTQLDGDTVPLDDRGLLLGDGLFETVLWKDGELVLWDRHVARLSAGAAVLGLAAPAPDVVRAAALDAVRRAGAPSRAAVRVTLTAGSGGRGLDRPPEPAPRLFATAAPSPTASGPVSLVLAGARRNDGSPAARLKTLAYLDNVLARREAQSLGADEAVMLNTRGQLACAAAANIFWISGDILSTPALACGVLNGIMRGEVLAQAAAGGVQVQEVATEAQALLTADAIFITNSLSGVRPAASMNGRRLQSHPMVEMLARRVAAVA